LPGADNSIDEAASPWICTERRRSQPGQIKSQPSQARHPQAPHVGHKSTPARRCRPRRVTRQDLKAAGGHRGKKSRREQSSSLACAHARSRRLARTRSRRVEPPARREQRGPGLLARGCRSPARSDEAATVPGPAAAVVQAPVAAATVVGGCASRSPSSSPSPCVLLLAVLLGSPETGVNGIGI
jgi:hypothetical protein